MVIKNLENKIKLVMIICSLFLVGCIIISLGSIWTARGMVSDAQKKIYVLDGNVPVLVNRSTMNAATNMASAMYMAGAASTIAVSFVTSPISAPRMIYTATAAALLNAPPI